MNFLVSLADGYSPALNPVLITAVICMGLVISLLLVLLAFFPGLTDSVIRIIDTFLYPAYRRDKPRTGSRAVKPTTKRNK